MDTQEVALQATTSMAAAPSKKGVRVKLPKTYGVVVRGGITHESNANDVRDALVTHYAFDPADAMLLSTQFANGISSRRGSELMEVVATFGRDHGAQVCAEGPKPQEAIGREDIVGQTGPPLLAKSVHEIVRIQFGQQSAPR